MIENFVYNLSFDILNEIGLFNNHTNFQYHNIGYLISKTNPEYLTMDFLSDSGFINSTNLNRTYNNNNIYIILDKFHSQKSFETLLFLQYSVFWLHENSCLARVERGRDICAMPRYINIKENRQKHNRQKVNYCSYVKFY